MQGYSSPQKRLLAEFFSSVAVGWFIAGVGLPFLNPGETLETLSNMVWGLSASYIFLQIALLLAEEER